MDPDPLDALADDVAGLLDNRSRVLVGLAGAPGTGKSTVAAALVDRLRDAGTRTALVPMDGFHLDQAELERLGRAHRKGAPDTFDVTGYVALLRRLRAATEPVTYAPRFDRHLEQSIGSAVAVDAATQVVVTEGNYLLLDADDLPSPVGDDDPVRAWSQVRGLLDRCWFVDTDDTVRVERLVARHVAHGRSPDAARAWVHGNDEVNAALVTRTRYRADAVVAWG
jgi:pantothenate kinase